MNLLRLQARKQIPLSKSIYLRYTFHRTKEASSVDIRTIYKFDTSIAEGAFAQVRKTTRLDNPNKQYAIKSFEKNKINNPKVLKMELEILASLDHPNIIKFFEYYQDNKNFYIVMEYCAGCELFEKVKNINLTRKKQRELFSK